MQVTSSDIKYRFMEIANRTKDLVIAHTEKYSFAPNDIELTQYEFDIIQNYVDVYKPPFADKSNCYTSWYKKESEPKVWPEYFLFGLKVKDIK